MFFWFIKLGSFRFKYFKAQLCPQTFPKNRDEPGQTRSFHWIWEEAFYLYICSPKGRCVCAQPARWLSPHNHLSLSQILQKRCLQLQSQILVVILSPLCAVVVPNLVEVFKTEAQVTEAGECLPDSSPAWGSCWSWASPAAVSDITVFLCCVCLEASWTTWN